jgi:hypothetical protein
VLTAARSVPYRGDVASACHRRGPRHSPHAQLIGKESNRLDETIAGLIGSLDDALATYSSPTQNTWTLLVRPALTDFPTSELAALTQLDTRTIQRIKKRATSAPHDRNRGLLTLITAQLATEQLEG